MRLKRVEMYGLAGVLIFGVARISQAGTVSLDLSPHGDADIRSKDLADNGYNRETLVIGNTGADPSSTRSYKAYIRYALPEDFYEATDATFTITRAVAGPWNYTYKIYGLDDGIGEDWIEANGPSGTTWNNAPGNVATSPWEFSSSIVVGEYTVIGTKNDGVAGDSYSIDSEDLVDFVNNDSNGFITLMIGRTNLSSAVEQFASRSHGSFNAPTLSLTYDQVPIPEPSSMALLSMAGGLLVLRSCKNS
ncbi:hypothetical protein KS4_13160 [Poriferisphaera corsica]|uniref:Carbohydrate-binding module family 96 domain-containing protein n=1 Tax=Poriferisphaera corsica TaxID=2528020 RepID=A0A517YST3_9BACT|nr:PEP-CTERM sorting domain-containing protein [Poriferisphaera corsica]QDU33271.1 hypothetical protein KS4_13160 [Poriferisphaera corsica]